VFPATVPFNLCCLAGGVVVISSYGTAMHLLTGKSMDNVDNGRISMSWLRWRSQHVALGQWLRALADGTFGSSKKVQKRLLSRLC